MDSWCLWDVLDELSRGGPATITVPVEMLEDLEDILGPNEETESDVCDGRREGGA
jgi:hypothetical protein